MKNLTKQIIKNYFICYLIIWYYFYCTYTFVSNSLYIYFAFSIRLYPDKRSAFCCIKSFSRNNISQKIKSKMKIYCFENFYTSNIIPKFSCKYSKISFFKKKAVSYFNLASVILLSSKYYKKFAKNYFIIAENVSN